MKTREIITHLKEVQANILKEIEVCDAENNRLSEALDKIDATIYSLKALSVKPEKKAPKKKRKKRKKYKKRGKMRKKPKIPQNSIAKGRDSPVRVIKGMENELLQRIKEKGQITSGELNHGLNSRKRKEAISNLLRDGRVVKEKILLKGSGRKFMFSLPKPKNEKIVGPNQEADKLLKEQEDKPKKTGKLTKRQLVEEAFQGGEWKTAQEVVDAIQSNYSTVQVYISTMLKEKMLEWQFCENSMMKKYRLYTGEFEKATFSQALGKLGLDKDKFALIVHEALKLDGLEEQFFKNKGIKFGKFKQLSDDYSTEFEIAGLEFREVDKKWLVFPTKKARDASY